MMKFPIAALSVIFLIAPEGADAAGFLTCDGVDCSFCNVVDMGNLIIKWLIGVLFVIAALLLAVAGIKLVISAGNPGAHRDAKKMFTNVLIGFIIVLAAWLIVDTLMRGLLNGENGTIVGWGPWQEVQCWQQVKTIEWLGDPTGPLARSNVDTTTQCAATPGGNVNCGEAVSSCQSKGGTPEVHEESGTQHSVNCWNVVRGSPPPLTSPAASCNGTNCAAITIPCGASANSNANCSISPDMVDRLAAMHSGAGVNGARVTEGYPPTRKHKNQCHYQGTCIDYSKRGGMTSQEVLSVYNSATAAGLRPVYEVGTETRRQELINAGVPADAVKNYGSWISGEHFSIYGR